MKRIRHTRELAGKKTVVVGIGTKNGGVTTALFARRCGAAVLALDLQNESALSASLAKLTQAGIPYRLGEHSRADIDWADIVLAAPGIRYDRGIMAYAAQQGKTVDSAIGLFMEAVEGKVVGVTGTKGKSLTAHLTGHLLQRAGCPVLVAGNNRVSPLRALTEERPVPVLELSSWQLYQTGPHERSPAVSCWLNFFPDHLNYYRTIDAYWADKCNITCYQTSSDFLVLPAGDPAFASLSTQARQCFFAAEHVIQPPARLLHYDRTGRLEMVWEGSTAVLPLSESDLAAAFPPHHRRQVLAALMTAWAYGSRRPEDTRAVLDFPGLPHRFERVTAGNGIIYINDSAATTPPSVQLALAAVSHPPLVLICGGGNPKGLSYSELSAIIPAHADRLILFAHDEASDQLVKPLPAGYLKNNVSRAADLEEAVKTGVDWLRGRSAGTLLLSPGCAGAPRWQDLYQRGDLFKKYVGEYVN
jgi:UDP-N-acetylmuramoylalanine--D-glutamate ligase